MSDTTMTKPEPLTKVQLLARHQDEMENHRRRASQQRQVIEALPDGVKVDKAYTTSEQIKRGGHSAAHGFYEITVGRYGYLRVMMETFPPVPVSRVEMQGLGKGSSSSLSFYPTARVPANWHEKHVVEPVAPCIWQAAPFGSSTDCRVAVEWYTEPKAGLFVLVRARVLEHGVKYQATANGGLSWLLRNYPAGHARFIKLVEGTAPFVTVWWGQFGAENTRPDARAGLDSLVAHLERGPRQ